MYIDYKKVAQKRALGKSKPGVIVDTSKIDWVEAKTIYSEASKAAKEMHLKAHKDAIDKAHQYRLKKKEDEYQLANPESGSYEGNWEDEFPHPGYRVPDDLAFVMNTAGERALLAQFVEHQGPQLLAALPELVKLWGSWHVTRNDRGLVSGLQFLKDHLTTDERIGMYRFLMISSKSDFLPKQYTGDNRTYCALVPIILYAQRIAKNIKYSEWDKDEIHHVVPARLAEAMTWEAEVIPSKDELLFGREQGLTWASGAKVGTTRPANSTHKLYATTGTVYHGMPWYVQVMYSQIWMAHPDNRTKYMVLDPQNWDSVPLPLIETTSIPESKSKTKHIGGITFEDTTNDYPWL